MATPKTAALLDYVTGWYFKAAEYIQGTRIVVGFVSTNSITQGEQVGVLWNHLFQHWAENSFRASHVCVGRARRAARPTSTLSSSASLHSTRPNKRIYDYERRKRHVCTQEHQPVSGRRPGSCFGQPRQAALNVPEMSIRQQAERWRQSYLLTDEEKRAELLTEPRRQNILSASWLRKNSSMAKTMVSLAGGRRLPSIREAHRKFMGVLKRFENSAGEQEEKTTRKLRRTPCTLRRNPSSQTRRLFCVPKSHPKTRPLYTFGFLSPDYIIRATVVSVISDATLFHFGVLMFGMHMAWMRQVCGRLKSRLSLFKRSCLQQFPVAKRHRQQRERVEEKARAVLAARKPHLPPRGLGTLADLYDPLTMPSELLKAHAGLDRAVEKCYRTDQFHSDRERVEFLFSLYEKLSAPLLPVTARARSRGSQSASSPRGPKPQRTPALPGQNQPTKA